MSAGASSATTIDAGAVRRLLQGRPVAVVGAGLVGSGWAIVFARAGVDVRIHDVAAGAADAALALIGTQLAALQQRGLVDDAAAILARCVVVPTLNEAVRGAAYVQESILEKVDLKRQLMEQLQETCDADAVIGSSTSGILASAFTSSLAIAPRVVIAHPVNPPYLVPVVEIVPSPATLPQTVDFAAALMTALGQSVVQVKREIEGFVLNRLQAVLLREAWALVQEGIASCEDVDRTVRDGLGWRWSFMGPFETIDLNASGGVADYARRLGPLYQAIDESRPHTQSWDALLIAKVEAQRREVLDFDSLAQRRAWRDGRLMDIAAERQNRPGKVED